MDALVITSNHTEIRPQPGPQEAFLSSPADIVIYGGSAGGGKTWGLLLDPLRDVDVKHFTGIFLRRTYPEITNQGGMWAESMKLYPLAGGRPTEGDLLWRFPSGAQLEFGHLQHEKNLLSYDGAQIAYLAFDQLEHFTEKMFWYMQIRNRSNCAVPGRLRATCNPDPNSFLINGPSGWGTGLIGWWIGEDGYALMERAGAVRWFVRVNEHMFWGDSREELLKEFPEELPVSITFIPATIYDNKILLANDPGYLAKLKNLPLVERERFLGDSVKGGNWKVKPAAGKVFNRSWFEIVEIIPDGGVDARGWDFAAKLQSLKSDDPDFTASVKMRLCPDGFYYITDVIEERMTEIDEYILKTSKQDVAIAKQANARYRVRWGTAPSDTGIREDARLKRLLAGLDADGLSEHGDKLMKWRPFMSACQAGKVRILAAQWTDRLLAHLHGQPDLDHDDITDGCQKAYDALQGVALVPSTKQIRTDNPWLSTGTRRR